MRNLAGQVVDGTDVIQCLALCRNVAREDEQIRLSRHICRCSGRSLHIGMCVREETNVHRRITFHRLKGIMRLPECAQFGEIRLSLRQRTEVHRVAARIVQLPHRNADFVNQRFGNHQAVAAVPVGFAADFYPR